MEDGEEKKSEHGQIKGRRWWRRQNKIQKQNKNHQIIPNSRAAELKNQPPATEIIKNSLSNHK